MTRRDRSPTILRYTAMTALAILFVFPALWMVTTSLKPEKETRKTIVPREIRIANYGDAIMFSHGTKAAESEGDTAPGAVPDDTKERPSFVRRYANAVVTVVRMPFFRQLANTLIIAVLSVIGVVLSSSLAAYAFARMKWPGRDIFFFLTVTTMMVPFAVKLVPLYGLFLDLGWIGTLKPLWAPAFFGTGFSIFLLRQFFKGIPQDLTDAARMDGCSEFDIYLRIVLPLATPALVAVGLFHFLYVWNDFFAPLVFLTDPNDFTLALGLHQFKSTHGSATSWTIMMAATTLVTTPIVVLFFFTQRFFVRGVTMTGMKG